MKVFLTYGILIMNVHIFLSHISLQRPESPLKIRRLAPTVEHFKWAVAIAQTRHITTGMTVGARPQVANMFIPYIGTFLLRACQVQLFVHVTPILFVVVKDKTAV